MKYYIWVDGEEHGPYEFEQLYGTWQDGSAPQGFLWRREDQKSFSMPEALTEEFERTKNTQNQTDSSPPMKEEKTEKPEEISYIQKIRRRSNYPITRFLLIICSWITYLLLLASILVWFFGPNSGKGSALRTGDAFMSTYLFVMGIICRVVYEFGMMIADHTDVQIDIGRSLAKRDSE